MAESSELAECVRHAAVRFLASMPRADALRKLNVIMAQAVATVPTVMQLLAELGLEEKASKRTPPATRLELLGFVLDTVEQSVSVTDARC